MWKVQIKTNKLKRGSNFKIHFKKIKLPDIAGVKMPSPIIIDVPIRTKSNRSVFRKDLRSNISFMYTALSSSGVGNLSLKLEIYSSAGVRFGRRLTFAYLQINEYNANVPPTTFKKITLHHKFEREQKITFKNCLNIYIYLLRCHLPQVR